MLEAGGDWLRNRAMPMTESIRNFWRGLRNERVDWNTRHNSRAYDLGLSTGLIGLFVVMPVLSIFGLGVLAGLWWC